MESVSLDPLELQDDLTFVRDHLVEFKDKTGSEVAAHIIDNWETEKSNFIKVQLYFSTKLLFLPFIIYYEASVARKMTNSNILIFLKMQKMLFIVIHQLGFIILHNLIKLKRREL